MTYREYVREAAREYVARVCADRTIDEAARVAGIHRSNLYRLRKRFGIRDREKHYGSWG